MSSDSAPINLTHHFLIAMPGLNDELFRKSVVYVCEHNARGALGLIINKPADIHVAELFDRLELPLRREDLRHAPLFRGGPLQAERGFVLHQPMGAAQQVGHDATPPAIAQAIREALSGLDRAMSPGHGAEPHAEPTSVLVVPHDTASDQPLPLPSAYTSTLHVPGGLDMTTSRDVLEAISAGVGPQAVLIALGYASWAEGQLESELGENSWLTVEANPEVIFDTPVEDRYNKAMSLLGLEPWMLAPGSGRA